MIDRIMRWIDQFKPIYMTGFSTKLLEWQIEQAHKDLRRNLLEERRARSKRRALWRSARPGSRL